MLTLFVVFFSTQCKKDAEDRVPSVPVDITINISLPSFINLTAPGGWVYLSGGSNGIIVYRNSTDEFTALDRHCTYQVDERDRVFVEDNNIIAVDSLGCGSKFSIADGLVTGGPAQFSLTQYQTNFNGTTQQLRIFN